MIYDPILTRNDIADPKSEQSKRLFLGFLTSTNYNHTCATSGKNRVVVLCPVHLKRFTK